MFMIIELELVVFSAVSLPHALSGQSQMHVLCKLCTCAASWETLQCYLAD